LKVSQLRTQEHELTRCSRLSVMSTPLSVSHTNPDRISPARSSPPSSTTSSVHLSTHAASEHSNGAPSSSSPYINNQQRSPQAFPTQASGSSIRPPYSPQTVAAPSRPSQPQPSQSQSSIPSSPQLDIPNGSLQQSTLYNAADPQALQALLSPAHQAMQANMQRPHEDASLYAGGGKQIQPERGERRLSGPTPEWAAAATAMRGDGTMSNMQGASKEAILKQVRKCLSRY